MHGASNRDTHLYPPSSRKHSSVYLTTTYVRRTGRITSGMRSGRTTLQDSALSSRTPAPTPSERLSQEQPGFDVTASAPMSGFSAPACANGACLLCGLWVWRRRTNRRPCCPPMSNPSTSSWSARRAGLRGGNGGNCPGTPLQGGPRDEIYLFQIKYSFENFSWFRSDTRTQLYYILMFY